MPTKHDAFISYSHSADGKLAKAIEEGIERLAKPLLKVRAADVFRDETSLAANPSLWTGIEEHLLGSGWFVLLACPESAASPWCTKEVLCWLEHRSVGRMLIVLTGGDLSWNPAAEDFDWPNSTALSKTLSKKFPDEPLYLDMRWTRQSEALALSNLKFRDAVLNLAAPIRAMRKDELDGADVRQFRRNRLLVRSGMAAICIAAVIAVWQAIVATRQRNEAVRQTRIALSRGISAIAQQKAATETDVALLLAAHATSLDSGFTAKAALLAAIQAHPRLQQLLWPGSRTSAGEFSPDGGRFATAGVEGAISIWDTATWRRRILIPSAHEGEVWAMAFALGGKQLVTAGLDQTAALWDVESGQQIGQRMMGHTDQILCAAVSPDGRRLATAGLDRAIRFWDLGQQRALRAISAAHVEGVRSLAFTPDGAKLVSGGFDGLIRVWDAADGRSLPGPGKTDSGAVMRLAFKPDGTLLASAGKNGAIRFWDPITWKPAREPLLDYKREVGGLAFSPNGKQLAAGGWDGVVRLWNLGSEDETTQEVFRYHQNQVWQVAFSPEGRLLASAGWDSAVALWDTDGSKSFRRELRMFPDEADALAFSPGNDVLAVGDEKGNVYLHKIQNASERGPVLPGQNGEIVGLTFSPGGSMLAAGTVDGTVQLWSVPAKQTLWKSREHGAGVFSLAFAPDEQMLISTGGDGRIVRWEIKTGRPMSAPVQAHSKGAGSAVLVLSANGKHFVSGGRGGDIILWDAPTGQQIRTLLKGEHESDGVDALAFSPDGRRLVAAKGAWLYFWEDGNWNKHGKYTTGHGRSITQIAFTPDSRTILAGGMGGLVFFWDVESKQAMQEPLRGWPRSMLHLAISSNGKLLAASFGGGFPPVIWNLETATWIDWAYRMANRELRPAEWAELVGPFPQTGPSRR